MSLKYLFLVLAVVYLVNCETQIMNSTEQYRPVNNSSRKSREIGSYIGMVSCAMQYDVLCFVDAAENYLEVRRTELLAQADAEVSRATGRSDPDSTPSHLAEVIGKMITELTKMFQNGISGYFTSARDADSDIDEEDNDLTDETDSDANGVSETRALNSSSKKKKKKPLKNLIRLIKVALIAIVVVLKLAIVLKVLQTAMQFKFLLISFAGFAIQAAKLWMSIRDKRNQHHEEIVYKNPFNSGDEYAGPGSSSTYGEYNARSSDAQNLAYSQQR